MVIGLGIILLAFALVFVNQTVDTTAENALLENCSGKVVVSGDSKLVRFNGSVTAKNANLTILDSNLTDLLCYNSTVEAYHNRIDFIQLENCTLTASLNTITNLIGKNSTYKNAWVSFSYHKLIIYKNETGTFKWIKWDEPKIDYVGNFWYFKVYTQNPVDSDRDGISDNIVCVKNINIDGAHFCERVLMATHDAYQLHAVFKEKLEAQPAPTTPTPTQTPEQQPAQPSPTPTQKSPGFEAIFAISGLIAVAYLIRRLRRWGG
jgi:hypothetical protein